MPREGCTFACRTIWARSWRRSPRAVSEWYLCSPAGIRASSCSGFRVDQRSGGSVIAATCTSSTAPITHSPRAARGRSSSRPSLMSCLCVTTSSPRPQRLARLRGPAVTTGTRQAPKDSAARSRAGNCRINSLAIVRAQSGSGTLVTATIGELMSEATDDGVAVPVSAFTEWKVRVGFGFALLCLGVMGIVSYLSLVRLNENAAVVEHTHEVLGSLELLLAAATDSETAERGYVITGDESYLEPYRDAGAVVDGQTRQLRELTADDRAQQQRLDSVVALVTERLAILRAVIELRKDQGFAAAQGEILAGKGKQFHDRIRRLIGQMEDTETSLLKEREQLTRRSSTIAEWVIIGGGVLACGLVALALWAIRRDFAGRARADRALRDARDQLELRVRQRTAELALTNQRTRALVGPALDGIVTMDHEGRITEFNPAAEGIFGYRRSEVIGRPLAEVLIPATLRERHRAGLARYLATGEGPVLGKRLELSGLRADGSEVAIELSIKRMPGDGPPSFAGFVRDLTERKLGEAKVQAQLARLHLLHQITRAIGERQDIQSIFQVVIRTLEEQLPVDVCCICLYDPPETCVIVTSAGLHS